MMKRLLQRVSASSGKLIVKRIHKSSYFTDDIHKEYQNIHCDLLSETQHLFFQLQISWKSFRM